MDERPSDLSSPGTDSVAADQLQVIATRVGAELFCIDILQVREIVRTSEFAVTRVPNAHGYVEGVVNLRGKIVPVIDLRQRLGLSTTGDGSKSRMVVVEIHDAIAGLTVDAVSEVLQLPRASFADTGGGHGRVANVNGQIMTFIEPRQLLGPGSLAADPMADTVEGA